MKKVLLISYFYPPLAGPGAQRIEKFVKFLPEFGWMPVVLTVKAPYYRIYATGESIKESETSVVRTSAFFPKRIMKRMFDIFEVMHRRKTDVQDGRTQNRPGAGKIMKSLIYPWLFIPDEYIGWYPFAVREGKRIVEREGVDVILSSSPPNTCHVIAAAIHEHTGVPWLADFRDVWDIWDFWYNPRGFSFRQAIERRLEAKTVESADAIAGVSEAMLTDFQMRFPSLSPERCLLLPNGFDSDDFTGIVPRDFGDGVHLVHAGSFYEWRRPDVFLHALAGFRERYPEDAQRLHVHFIGHLEYEHRRLINELDLDSMLTIRDTLSYKECLSWIYGADALLLIPGDITNSAAMVTTKVFDYIMSQKPIVIIGEECGAVQLIQKVHAPHLWIRGGKQQEIIEAFAELCRAPNRNQQPSLDTEAFSQYHRRSLTQTLAQCLDRLSSSSTAGRLRRCYLF